MNFVPNKNVKNAALGLLTGVVMFFVPVWLDYLLGDVEFSLIEFLKNVKNTPSYWALLSLPAVLPLLAYQISKIYYKYSSQIVQQTDVYEKKETLIMSFITKFKENNIDDLDKGLDDSDDLSISLKELSGEIKDNKNDEIVRKKEDEQRNWATEGMANFGEILRQDNNDLEKLSHNVISNLVKYIGANQGGFFYLNDDDENEKFFELTAFVAYDRKKFTNKRVEWGVGLVGACALERNKIVLSEVPEEYVNITSGLGDANPSMVLLIPLKVNDEVHGVLELASFKVFEGYQIAFLEEVAESIASTLSSVKINIRTKDLLKESQFQAEKMSQQEEEMRQNLEELRATQEEAARQSREFEEFTNSVNHTLIRAEYGVDGNCIYANTKFLEAMEYESNSDVEGQHIYSFIDEKDVEWFGDIWSRLSTGGKHFDGDMKHITKSGKELWTHATYVCVRNQNGNVNKILFLGSDITDRKMQNLDYEGQISAIDLSGLKADFSSKGSLTQCNSIFAETLGYENDEVIGKLFYDFCGSDDSDTMFELWKDVVKGKAFSGQLKHCSKSGEEKWFRATLIAVNDMYGKVSKVIYISNDITEQKLIELEADTQRQKLIDQDEALRKAKDEVEDKLKEARGEMQHQFKEIEKIKIRNEKTLEGALDAIITINDKGVIEFFNEAAVELWGYKKKDVIDKNVQILFPELGESPDEFVEAFVSPDKEKFVGERKEVNILNTEDEEVSVLILLSEAEVEGEKTYTAFIQNIEVELF